MYDISQKVRQQYEEFPYPDFDLNFDKPRLLVSGHLGLMSEVLWAGKKEPGDLRVLDAGCGTGGPLVAMAVAFPQTEIIGIDFSEASLAKARLLAEKYNCKNVRFHHLPIQEISTLGQTFDLITSSGVLHHLPDPAEGLRALGEVLGPQGAVSIMLYGKYGRTGVYMMQEVFDILGRVPSRSLDSPESELPSTMSQRARFAHRMALCVPPWHPLGPRLKGREMQEGKEAGIVDLLLHANDIPFDVPAVYKLCQEARMRFHRWLIPLIYNLDNYFTDPLLSNRMTPGKMPRPKQEELAELAHGRNSKHSFFAVRPEFQPPAVSIKNGNWRKLHAKLTPCMAWNRTAPIPPKPGEVRKKGREEMFSVPFTIVQDAWGPLRIARWELAFLSQILPEIPLGDIIRKPEIEKLLPFRSPDRVDQAVETLLQKALDRLALVWLEK